MAKAATPKPKRVRAPKPPAEGEALDLVLAALDEAQIEQVLAAIRTRWQKLRAPAPAASTPLSIKGRLEALHSDVHDLQLASLQSADRLALRQVKASLAAAIQPLSFDPHDDDYIIFRESTVAQRQPGKIMAFDSNADPMPLTKLCFYTDNVTGYDPADYEPTEFFGDLSADDPKTGGREHCPIYKKKNL